MQNVNINNIDFDGYTFLHTYNYYLAILLLVACPLQQFFFNNSIYSLGQVCCKTERTRKNQKGFSHGIIEYLSKSKV